VAQKNFGGKEDLKLAGPGFGISSSTGPAWRPAEADAAIEINENVHLGTVDADHGFARKPCGSSLGACNAADT
jgi:hypothetical protein